MSERRTEWLAVRVSPTEMDEMQELAREERTTVSAIVRRAVYEQVKKHRNAYAGTGEES